MIKALENNIVGLALAYTCGALLLVALGLIVLWALPPSPDMTVDETEGLQDIEIVALAANKPFDQYEEIARRPVFNEDRRPSAVEESDDEPELLVEEDLDAPEVELAGVVITPSLRMATLKSKEHKHSLVAFEGKPLEGNFGSWHVSSIAERAVTLSSSDGREMQLELQVHNAVIKEPPKAAGASAPGDDEEGVESGDAPTDEEAEQLTRAEEIRRRIEERREELRRQAEENEANRGENYSEAIQSMMHNSRQRRENNNDG